MPRQMLELGATQLLELGASELLELGNTRIFMGDTPAPQTITAVYDFVKVFEDPLAATGISDDELTPEALSIVNRIRTINRRTRNSLGSTISLGDIDGYESLTALGHQLHGLYLGKSFFKKVAKKVKNIHKTVAKKVINVVKSPAFLSVAALVVNVIPGIGQAASVALAAAATARKLYAQKIDEKKAKKAQAAFNAQQQAEFLKEIQDYNRKTQEYYESAKYPIPLGQMLNANGDPTNIPAEMPGIKYPININGTVYNDPKPPAPTPAPAAPPPAAVVTQPNPTTPAAQQVSPVPIQPPPTQQQVTQAAAIPIAMSLNNGQSAWQANAVLHSFPLNDQRAIAGEVSEIQKYVSDPTFRPTSVKAIGQFVAMSEFDRGAGTNIMTEEQHALAEAVKANATPEVQKAIEAGRQALITSAAIDGKDASDAIAAAIAKGSSSSIPWTYILIGLGLAAAGGVGYALARR